MSGTAPEARLLVVEDEPNILELLAASLRLDGFEVARRLRSGDTRTPVLFLTAKDATE